MRILLLLILLSPASYSACLDTAYSTIEMRECHMDELKSEEQKLNNMLQKAYKVSPNIAKEIERSQIAWLAYRNSHCSAVYSSYDFGTMRLIATPACLVSLTKLRIDEVYTDFVETY